MSCKQCRQWWSPYLDSELDASKTFEVSEHLRTCEACRDRFEREECVDQWMRNRLREGRMPDELWASIGENVRSHPRVVRFPLLWPVAVAACVALIALGVLYYDRKRSGAPGQPTPLIAARQSVAELLQGAAPQLAAFSEAPAADFAEQLAAASRRILGATVSIAPDAGAGHAIELVGVRPRTDALGSAYLELRLNCCGRPVLLALARTGGKHAIIELGVPTDHRRTKPGSSDLDAHDIESVSVERHGVTIAAAAADHSPQSILKIIRVKRA